ncbi:Uncharacterised protein [Listeria grayi]|uniref:Uncharacterized protein n=1 Tax=Listeria grayi FSL F6-1183 TaxID=1265827 RepID=A0A829RB92_LISGR|nr:hypothetical protein [Listeria grayi]EUJ30113.1 hypothetical protein LMUR_03522 [Listeria grayi FSL F6-1183]VEI33778.1 Uncharacterised protein [Listeria grayi]
MKVIEGITSIVGVISFGILIIPMIVIAFHWNKNMYAFASVDEKSKVFAGNVFVTFGMFLVAGLAQVWASTSKDETTINLYFVLMILAFIEGAAIWIHYNIMRARAPLCYFIINNELYRVIIISGSIIYLKSERNGSEEIIVREKSILFEDRHILMNNTQYKQFKTFRPDLFCKENRNTYWKL